MSLCTMSRGPIVLATVRYAALTVLLCGAPPGVFLADEPISAVGPLMKLYQSGRLPAERQPAVVEMICNRGNEKDLRVVFEKVLTPDGMAAPLRIKALGWLAEAARTRKVKPAGDLAGVAALVASPEAALRLAAGRLAGALHLEGAAPALRQIPTAAESPRRPRDTAH